MVAVTLITVGLLLVNASGPGPLLDDTGAASDRPTTTSKVAVLDSVIDWDAFTTTRE